MRKWTARLLEQPTPETMEWITSCISCEQRIGIGAKVFYVKGYFENDEDATSEYVLGGYIHKKCHTQRLVTAKLLNA